jgi:acylphosphatase
MDHGEPCVQFRAIVRGQVQGVGYRMWAQRRARMLGVSGYVCNLMDDSVEVVGEGSRETLELFLADLRRGPESAVVRSIQVTWDTCAGESDRFEIRRS